MVKLTHALFCIFTILGILASCSTLPPPEKPERVLYNLSYGSKRLQKLDVFLPEKTSVKHGIVIVVHGGGWMAGDKKDMHHVGKFLASRGYVTVTPNYRLSLPIGSFGPTIDDMLDDLDAVKSYAESMQDSWGCDASKLAFVGHSAGAHLSLMQALTRNKTGSIKCCASFSGPTDLTDPLLHDNFVGVLKGDRLVSCAVGTVWDGENPFTVALFERMSPLYRAWDADVPILLVQATDDRIVPWLQVSTFNERLLAAGNRVTFITAEGMGHELEQEGYLRSITVNNLIPLLRETID